MKPRTFRGISRRTFGRALCSSGALLAGLGLGRAAGRLRARGRILLDRVPAAPAGLVSAAGFPLIDALHGRRSRRFGLGCSIPEGPLAHASRHDPVPLSDLEQLLVLTATAGNTGWHHLIPHNPAYLPHIPNYAGSAGGRTFPSGGGIHTTEFFYTDDSGTYFFPTRDAPALAGYGADGSIDLDAWLGGHRARIRRISERRLELLARPQHMEMHNPWCANRPGSTLIIPVADAAQHYIANLCYWVQNGVAIVDDVSGKPIPGLQRFRSLVDLDHPLPLSVVEQIALAEVTAEISTACYAGMLMLQAIGLGGWMYGGLNPFSVLGASGDPEVPGLGFRFDADDRWPLPNVTGLPGVMEGFCPPHYDDVADAVDAFIERKFGPGGPFHPATPGPYRNTGRVRGTAERHGPDFRDCVVTMARHVHDQYGRLPATFSSMYAFTYLQAHHLDLEFYDRHFGPGSYLETHAQHMERWHAA